MYVMYVMYIMYVMYEMTEKNVSKQTNRQTDRHVRVYISKDIFCFIFYFSIRVKILHTLVSLSGDPNVCNMILLYRPFKI